MRSLRSHKRTPSGAGCAIQTYDTIRVHFFTALILFFGVIIRTDESLRCSALRPDDMTTANIVFERQLPRIFALYCTRPVLVLHCAFYSPNESLHSLRSGRGGGVLLGRNVDYISNLPKSSIDHLLLQFGSATRRFYYSPLLWCS